MRKLLFLCSLLLFAVTSCSDDADVTSSANVESVLLSINGEKVAGANYGSTLTKTIKISDEFTISPVILPNNDDNQEYNWVIKNYDEAITFNGVTGKIVGKNAGTATVTVVSNADNSVYAEITVTVLDVNDVLLTSDSETSLIEINSPITITADLAGQEYQSISWEITDGSSYASISSSDNSSVTVLATSEGSVTVTATVTIEDGVTTTKDFSFKIVNSIIPVSTITLYVDGTEATSGDSFDLTVDDSFILVAAVNIDATTKTYNWEITGDDCISFSGSNNSNGTVTATAKGTATITVASAEDNTINHCIVVNVTNYAKEEEVTISSTMDDEILTGESTTLTLDFNGRDYESVNWSISGSEASITSSTNTEASIDIEGVSEGEVTLTASIVIGNGVTFTKTYTVKVSIPFVGPAAYDYYYSDFTYSTNIESGKTIIGIVYSVDKDNRVANVINNNAPNLNCRWATDECYYLTNQLATTVNDTEPGLTNMAAVQDVNNDFTEFPAFKVAHDMNVANFGSNIDYSTADYNNMWVIPNSSQLVVLCQWLSTVGGTEGVLASGSYDDINQMFLDAGSTSGTEFNSNRRLWSSYDTGSVATAGNGTIMTHMVQFTTTTGYSIQAQQKSLEGENNGYAASILQFKF